MVRRGRHYSVEVGDIHIPTEWTPATVVNCTAVNIREAPSYESRILKILNALDTVKVRDNSEEFYEVRCSDDIVGFSCKKYFAIEVGADHVGV